MSDYDYGHRRYPRRGSPVRISEQSRTVEHLDHVANHGASRLHRTRSFGSSPVPQVNVYNDVVQDAIMPNAVPNSGLHENMANDRLLREIALLARENGRLALQESDRYDTRLSSGLEKRKYDINQIQKDLWWRRELENVKERTRTDMELERLRDETKKTSKEARAKDERKRIIEEYETDKREREARRKSVEDRIRQQMELEEREAKVKEDRDWESFLRKQSELVEKGRKEKQEAEEQIEAEMSKRLFALGLPPAEVDAVVRARDDNGDRASSNTAFQKWRPRGPVYPKVRREYLSVDTLKYYRVPYEYDQADSDYIIILREMDRSETEALFDHTKRLRQSKLLLPSVTDRPRHAWFRRSQRGGGRRASGVVKTIL